MDEELWTPIPEVAPTSPDYLITDVEGTTTGFGGTTVDQNIKARETDWVELGKDIQVFVYPIIIFIGVVGNICTLVLMQKSFLRKSTTSIYFSALAVADTMVLVYHMTSHWLSAFDSESAFWKDNNIRCWCGLLIYLFLMAWSTWLMVGLTFERFIVTTFPLKGKIWCTRKAALGTVLGITFFFAGFWSVVLFWRGVANVPYCVREEYFREVVATVNMASRALIPSFLLVVTNSALIYQLVKARRQRMKLTGAPQGVSVTTRPTIIAITVSVCYLVLTVPSAVVSGMDVMEMNQVKTPEAQFVNRIFLVTRLVNHSINFFLFLLSSPKMRSEFVSMVKCGHCALSPDDENMSGSGMPGSGMPGSRMSGSGMSGSRMSGSGMTNMSQQTVATSGM